MPSAAFPAVTAAVFALGQSVLPGVRVIRGRDISQDPSDAVHVGILTPDESVGLDWATAGRFDQEMQRFSGPRQETGTVNCLAKASNGDQDPTAAATQAFGYIAAIEAGLRADPTIGLTGYDFVVTEMQGGDVMEAQTDGGVIVAVAFAIAYRIGI
jgi:hypothetical protein